MSGYFGAIFALTALLSWGIGDFLIQRSARKFGDWIALFFIDMFGVIVLFPFIWKDLISLFDSRSDVLLLIGASLVLFVAAIVDFEALRVGKLSVVEPIYAFEVPITVMLGTFLAHEALTRPQNAFILILTLGIFLVSTKSFHHLKRIHAERGIFLAFFTSVMMGSANFLVGIGARATDPLLINWFFSPLIAILCAVYITFTKRWSTVVSHWNKNKSLILTVGFFDNLAWVAYASAVLYLPIAIAIGVSEAYIALAALLGIFLNREKLLKHQYAGLVLSVIAVTVLIFISES